MPPYEPAFDEEYINLPEVARERDRKRTFQIPESDESEPKSVTRDQMKLDLFEDGETEHS